jgi:hypothetical protein
MDKTNRAKALIEFYRSINPSVVNDWNIVNEIKNDLEIYLNSYSYEEMKKATTSYDCDEYYNESY